MSDVDVYWDFLIDNGIVSEDALRLVTDINGYSEDTLDDVLYCQTGNRSIEQYCDENDVENPFSESVVRESSVNSMNFIMHNLLEGKSLSEAMLLKESLDNDKIQALLQFLDKDVNDEDELNKVFNASYNDNVYYYDSDRNDFLICTDAEADEEYTSSIDNFIDELGVDGFTPYARDYILENCCDTDAIIDYYQDDQRGYAEDIQTEDDPIDITVADPETGEPKDITVHNRLFKEIIENDIATTDDFDASDFNEDGEYIGDTDLVELWCDKYQTPEDQGYDSPYDWLLFDFGKDYANDFVKDHCSLDIDAVAEYVKSEDGRGHGLNSWDGKEYEETVNGTTYYIYPNCDFEELMD